MKKIIYSLVIMIAAGSLFTSCIEQVEPVGLLDMRTAKAEYIRALKDLRAADAEYVRAKAAVKQADARYRDAETAFKNAQVENQKLLNDLQELWNEATAQENVRRAAEIAAEIEGIQMKMEELAAKHAVEMVKYEAQLAQAQEGLRVVLRDIAIASKSLSPNEKLAVVESAALVAVLTDAQAKAMKDVNEAQKYLDSLSFKALVAGTTWADGYLEDLEEHYEDLIEEEQAKIAIAEVAKALVPLATAQISEWQDVVDGYAEDSLAIAQEMAQQTYDSTAYFSATVQPGIVKFNKAIADWIDENWEEVKGQEGILAEPDYTAEQAAWIGQAAPVRTATKYWETYDGPADSLTFSPLTEIRSKANFSKFEFLLSSYNQDNKFWKSNPDHKPFIGTEKAITTDEDSVVIYGKINKEMQDFILGKPGNKKGSQTYGTGTNKVTADYGLWGAYDIMERELVTPDNKVHIDTDSLENVIDSLANVWTAHRDILKEGYAKYAPKVAADSELQQAKQKRTEDSTAMMNAVKALYTKLNTLAEKKNWTDDDSTALLAVIVNYAAARDNYLETADTVGKSIAYPYAKTHSPHWFYYSRTTVDNQPVIDSVEFAKLNTIPAYYYQYNTEGVRNAYASEMFAEYKWGTDTTMANAFHNILSQMFGEEFVDVQEYTVTPTGSDPTTYHDIKLVMNVLSTTVETNYKLLSDRQEEGYSLPWYLDNWAATTPKLMPNDAASAYVPAYVKAAEEKVAKAKADYLKVYNAFWATNETEIPTSPLDPTVYTLETFKDFADGSPIITFGENGVIEATDPLCAVLTAVDPACENRSDNDWFIEEERTIANASKILGDVALLGGTKHTDLYKWAAVKWELYKAKDHSGDLAAIKAWVEGVEKIFVDNAAKTPKTRMKTTTYDGKSMTVFAKDSIIYDSYLKRKVEVDAYKEAKKAFVGERIEGTDTLPNNLFIVRDNEDPKVDNVDPVDTVKKGKVAFKLTKDMAQATFESTLFTTNAFGDLVGWTKMLDGQQLANAKEFFGEEPYEQIQDWKVARKVNEAKQATLHELKELAEAVFVQKARVEGLADEPDSTTLASIQNSWKTYVETLDTKITEAKKKINGDPDVEGDKGYAGKLADAIAGNIDAEYLIKDAQIELAAAEARLENITKLLEKAQANLDKIMEYIRSTDAEFVIPVTIEEIDALINNVEENIGLATQIQALIAAYMGGATEEGDATEDGGDEGSE